MHKAWRLLGRMLYKPVFIIVSRFFKNSHRTRVAVLVDNQVLVVDGWLSDGHWRLPGGGMHRNEDGSSAARRELYEELRIEFDDKQLEFVGEKDANENGIRFKAHYYLIKMTKKPQITSRKVEIMDYTWLSLDQAGSGFLAEQLSEYNFSTNSKKHII